jgi:hypothetical protein
MRTPSTFWRLAERVAAIAPATPTRAAPEASSGTFAFCASGGTLFALRFTESATPFDAELDFDFAVALAFPVGFLALGRDPCEPLLALVRDPFEPFDLGLEDRDPRELELDRRALDFDLAFV